MKPSEAEPRIRALVEFRQAVGDVLTLTDFAHDGFGGGASRPKPGHEHDWMAAKARADRLVAAAARSYAMVNATISYKARGTWDRYPINPANHWATILSDDPMFGPDLLDTMTNQAIGAYENALEDPPKRDRVSIDGFSLPAWLGALAYTVIGGLIVAGLVYLLGWVG